VLTPARLGSSPTRSDSSPERGARPAGRRALLAFTFATAGTSPQSGSHLATATSEPFLSASGTMPADTRFQSRFPAATSIPPSSRPSLLRAKTEREADRERSRLRIEQRTRSSPIGPSTRSSASEASRRPSKSPEPGARKRKDDRTAPPLARFRTISRWPGLARQRSTPASPWLRYSASPAARLPRSFQASSPRGP